MAKTKKTVEQTLTAQPVTPSNTVDIVTLPNLHPGVTGRRVYVRMLQEALTRKGFRCAATGAYDDATARAVQRMQIANGMLPNARVGTAEWAALTR